MVGWCSRRYGVQTMVGKHLRVIVITLLLVAGTVAVRAEPYQIVGFGDSLMAGYGLPPGEGFTEKLQAALNAEGHDVIVANAGVSGDTSSGGLSRLDWSVPDGTGLVLLELGANDMLRGIDPALTRANLDSMLTRLADRKIPVLLIGMRAAPNLGPDYQKAFDAIFPGLAAKFDVPLYPFILEGVAADPSLLLDDGMHPNAAGIDRMVAAITPQIAALLPR